VEAHVTEIENYTRGSQRTTYVEAHVTVEENYTRGSKHNIDRELHTRKRT